jgi:CheY-like chemotaxis protein
MTAHVGPWLALLDDPTAGSWVPIAVGVGGLVVSLIVGLKQWRTQRDTTEISSSAQLQGYAFEAMKATIAARDTTIVRQDAEITYLRGELQKRGGFPSGPISPEAVALAKNGATAPRRRRLLEDVRILIVENDSQVCEYLAMDLASEGAECECQRSADDAERVYGEDDRGFDVLLLDLNLGRGRSGISLLRALHQQDDARGRRRPPAIAVTGESASERGNEARRAGFASFVEKPINRDLLLLTIRTAAGKR